MTTSQKTKEMSDTQSAKILSNNDVEKLIKNHEVEGGHVDTIHLASNMGFFVVKEPPRDSTAVAEMSLENGSERKIRLSNKFSKQEQNCALAWVLAEYIIHKSALQHSPIICSVFSLREFRKNRYSRTMLLATRLVMTEDSISKMNELDNNTLQNALAEHITFEFANSGVKGHSVAFLIGNNYI
jgi:hypothetical protein